MCDKKIKLDESEKEARRVERQENHQENNQENNQESHQQSHQENHQENHQDEGHENSQEKIHPGNLDISELDYDVGDLYEFYECADKLESLVGTDEFYSYKQSMIDRVWYLPDDACDAYRDLLGVGYKDPPPRDHPYYIINY
ncbi:hypothetical protein JCM33374_g5490 [Metschnikowia sp. JCM 33374]|nr:hypothetical protein JCM33374_g5490 [Metschnikowia sp. JCM 33374]